MTSGRRGSDGIVPQKLARRCTSGQPFDHAVGSLKDPRTHLTPPGRPTPYAGGMEFLAFAIGGSCIFAIGAMVFAAINRDD